MDATIDRRTDDDVRVEAARAFSLLFIAGGVLVLCVGLLTWVKPIPGYDAMPLTAFGIGTVVGGCASYVLRRHVSNTAFFIVGIAANVLTTVVSLNFVAAPSFGPVVLLWLILFAFGYLPRGQAILQSAFGLAGMAVLFALQPGWPNPVAFGVFLGGTIVVTAWFVRTLVARSESLAEAEHAAHLELAKMNETLEARVAEQVDELDRLARLRRFLSPSVAEAVVSTEGLSRLAPHRAQIAAVFCDLRGFTSFSSEAEPEDVTALLGRFHDVISPLVDRYEATVGGFAGDGVALYFNDPIPCPDPAVRAVRLALDLEAPMRELTTEWRRLGFEVGYGVGIALGYATLGVIGIEHRREYTAIGSVMNLASRLSDEAGPSEILLDARAAAAVQEQIRTEPTDDLTLKGFSRPVQAYRVLSTTRDGS